MKMSVDNNVSIALFFNEFIFITDTPQAQLMSKIGFNPEIQDRYRLLFGRKTTEYKKIETFEIGTTKFDAL